MLNHDLSDFNFRKPLGRTFVGKQSALAYDLARINRIGTSTFSPVTESYLGEVTYLSEGIFSRIVDAFKSVVLKEPLLSKLLALRGLKKTLDPGAYAVKVKEVKTMTMSYLMKAGGIASAVIAFIEHKKIEKIVEILVEHVMLHHTQSMASIITHVLQLAMTSLHLVMSKELQGNILAEKRVNGKVTDTLMAELTESHIKLSIEEKDVYDYTTNNGDIYRQRITSIIKNLKQKISKKVFNQKLAAKLFVYAVEDGIKAYNKEFKTSIKLNPASRLIVAEEMLEHYQEEIGFTFKK